MFPVLKTTTGYKKISEWLSRKGYQPFLFQQQTWQHIINGESGLVNAPTGCGKTFSVFLGAAFAFVKHLSYNSLLIKKILVSFKWITPIKVIAQEKVRAREEVIR